MIQVVTLKKRYSLKVQLKGTFSADDAEKGKRRAD
jgi:hypothetical protein